MLALRRLSWSCLGNGGSASDSAGEVARASDDRFGSGESRSGPSNEARGRSLGGTDGGGASGGEEGSEEGGEERVVSWVARDGGLWDEVEARLDRSSSSGVVSPSEGGGLGGGPPILDESPVLSIDDCEVATSSGGTSPPGPAPNTPLTAAPSRLTPSSTWFVVDPGPGRMTTPLFGEILWMWTSVGGGCEGGERARSPLAGGRTAAY
jgi:hypothetical protein